MNKRAIIIGSGLSSLTAASYLAKAGMDVEVYEKNGHIGGRVRSFEKDGFTFDMGPSWYWMPDVFEKYYKDFGYSTADLYQLDRLDPGYQVVFKDGSIIPIGASMNDIYAVFEQEETGSSKALKSFMERAANNYDIAIKDLVYRPGESIFELISPETIKNVGLFFKSIQSDIHKKIKNPKLREILEFPVLFLGAKPSNTPAFYSFMNQADFGLGTWHPKGGMSQIAKAFKRIAKEQGVQLYTDQPVDEILVEDDKAIGIRIGEKRIDADLVLSGADYHHSESLLPKEYRQYSEAYWDKKVFAPSCLLFYVGLDCKIDNLKHHNLFFDTDFNKHASEIYDKPSWPEDPLFYANFPSISDESFAPKGKENAFFLIPIAPGLEEREDLHEHYFEMILNRLSKIEGKNLKDKVLFHRSFSVSDFKKEYNSFKGNAYGLANTLLQTAFLRPKLKSKKVENLYFTGQLTVPGPGLPPAIISGKVVSDLILKNQTQTQTQTKPHESLI
jgi:phytoene desaturase